MTVDDAPIGYELVEQTASNSYPVDSRTRQCCGGIGRHTLDCKVGRLYNAELAALSLAEIRAELRRRGLTDDDIAAQVGCSVDKLGEV